MSTPFFITGLPRSRTAWLSVLFSHGRSTCMHDGVKFGRNDFAQALTSSPLDYSGDSDSGLLIYWPTVCEMFPEAKWVIIKRDASACRESYRKYFKGRIYCGSELVNDHTNQVFDVLSNAFHKAIEGIPSERLMEVDFDALEDESTVKAVWEWLTPENPWDQARYEMLQQMQINLIPEKVRFNVCQQQVL